MGAPRLHPLMVGAVYAVSEHLRRPRYTPLTDGDRWNPCGVPQTENPEGARHQGTYACREGLWGGGVGPGFPDPSNGVVPARDDSEGKGLQRRPQKPLDSRLEEVAKAVGGLFGAHLGQFRPLSSPKEP